MIRFVSLFVLYIFSYHTEGYAQSKIHVASKSASVPLKASVRRAKAEFITQKIDLGTIKEDAIVERFFEFTNTGGTDLLIINAEGSCGCTVPTVPMEPIKPGEKGRIAVKFTAKNKVGPQKNIIKVATNGAPAVIQLQLECWVNQIPGGVKE